MSAWNLLQTSRREWLSSLGLTCGTLAFGRAITTARSARGAESPPGTAVIFVTMGGGASQFETFDPKPAAPSEYRGVFQPISTQTPGEQFCELFPNLATQSHQMAVVRSIHHEQASHIAEHIVETGYDLLNFNKTLTGDMPSVGAAVSRVRGKSSSGIPAYVSIPRHHGYSGPHWLGPQHHFFAVDDDPNANEFRVSNLKLSDSLPVERLQDRRQLQDRLSRRGGADMGFGASAIDQFSQQAFELVSGERARQAFAIETEDPRLRERYGRNPFGQRLLLARRLVEAGVPFIKVRTFDWDDHAELPAKIRDRAPAFDQGVATLIDDLSQRGLAREVLVVAMGEFGRTPRINPNGGRDHFPAVNSVFFAGGNYRMGQIIGQTDRLGSVVQQAPYRPQNVHAMVYRHLGIDPGLTFQDFTGRPRHLLEERGDIAELL